jgi:hypothetical protein
MGLAHQGKDTTITQSSQTDNSFQASSRQKMHSEPFSLLYIGVMIYYTPADADKATVFTICYAYPAGPFRLCRPSYMYKNIIHIDDNPLSSGAGSRCRLINILTFPASYGFNVAFVKNGTAVAYALQSRASNVRSLKP